uniref:Uncharacterized protein n=1 Tax=Triticum urartu TaxID=4572 RepID=A0A8R7P3Y3_TRIUA
MIFPPSFLDSSSWNDNQVISFPFLFPGFCSLSLLHKLK